MRFSIISLAFVFLFVSCGIPTVKNLSEQPLTITKFANSYFANVNTDYVYKTKINAYGNTFGGILIIKKLKPKNHRIVFTTNFGNKIFDFELINDTAKTHYIIEELNRKIIINRLKNDFKILTREDNTIDKIFIKNKQYSIYQSKIKNRYNHFLVSTTTQELTEIIHTSRTKEKISIKFSQIQNSIANNISIEHKKMPIRIDLSFLEN